MFYAKEFSVATLLTLAMCSTANASSVTYDYLGNNFDSFNAYDGVTGIYNVDTLPSTIGPRITGSVTFADGIDNAVTSFMLTDGIHTLSNDTINLTNNLFSMTFNNDNVDTWYVNLSADDHLIDANNHNYVQLITVNSNNNDFYTTDVSIFSQISLYGSQRLYGYGNNLGNYGTWTLHQDEVSSVPVPAALPLMASALGLFGLTRRRKQSV